MLNGLDLFSGIGGISIALREWVRPIAYCEIDPYCQGVLLSNMERQFITKAPIWDDIRTMSRTDLPKTIDIIYGGFPCQDISITGPGKGLAGERSGLFFEIMRLAKEIKPSFIFLENVPAITTRGGLDVVREIAEAGYDCRWCTLSAKEVAAHHHRERWFLLAHTKSERQQETGQSFGSETPFSMCDNPIEYDCWHKEPEDKLEVDGMVDGLRTRSHRIRALGNAVVPIQAKTAFEELMGIRKHGREVMQRFAKP